MKITLKIAKNELRYLFYSPIAWFLIIAFLVQCGVIYSGRMADLVNEQDLMMKNRPEYTPMGSLTLMLFIKLGIFNIVMSNLYLFIPLLTMGLISREVDNGTARLLYSSPIRLRQIVFGKFIGIAGYCLLLVLILVLFVVMAFFNIREADMGLLFSAVLGFYLLVCTYAAIGLFMSTLSNNQIVSAISTFAVIFILSRIGDLWQRYDLVRDLTYFLSLQNRTYKMLGGLIVSRDLIYFVLVTGMFIAFTLIRLRTAREDKPWFIRVGRYALVLAVTLTIGYISSRPAMTGYLDATATQRNTIPPQMQQILKDMGDTTLEVTLYGNMLGDGLGRTLPENRNADYFSNFWDPYLRFKPDIKFNFEYYYNTVFTHEDSLALKGKSLKKVAEETAGVLDFDLAMFNSTEAVKKDAYLRPEGYRAVLEFKYQGRNAFARTYNDEYFWPDLRNLTAVFKKVQGEHMPKVYFINGNLERSISRMGERDYTAHAAYKKGRGTLVNTGFEVDSLDLSKQEIPADADVLVLADPKVELPVTVMNKLKNYISAGGNMFITGEPGKQQILNPLLRQMGVQLMNGQLVQPSFDETPDKVTPYVTSAGTVMDKELAQMLQGSLFSKDTLRALMPGVAPFSYTQDSGFVIRPLLETFRNKAWLKAGKLVTDSTLPDFNTAEGDIKQSTFTTGLQLTRKLPNKEQRIIICGDADFASNGRFGKHIYFLMPVYSYTTYNHFPIFMPNQKSKDIWFSIGPTTAAVQKVIFTWILPGAMLLFGTILLLRRKRK